MGPISLIFFSCAAFLVSRRLSAGKWTALSVNFLLILFAQLVITGQVLSFLRILSNAGGWFIASLLFSGAALFLYGKTGGSPEPLLPDIRREIKGIGAEVRRLPFMPRLAVYVTVVTFLTAAAANIISMSTCLPHNWDSIASHLTRAAYYLQFDSMDIFHSNYWAHDAHPRNGAILWVYTLGIINNEHAPQFVQFAAYLGTGLIVYALSRELRAPRPAAIFAATVFLLLVENLLESVTVQNDLLLNFFSGVVIYQLIIFTRERCRRHLLLAAAGACLAVGVKGTFLMQAPVWIIFLYTALRRNKGDAMKTDTVTGKAAALLLAVLLVVLLGDGMSYWRNYQYYGHAFGPETAQQKSFTGAPVREIATEGSKNLLRYAFDFFSLDGLSYDRRLGRAELMLKRTVLELLNNGGVHLAKGKMQVPFAPREPATDEDFSWWGIMGILLIPAGLFYVLLRMRPVASLSRLLAISGVVFIIAQAYIGPYDPWRGRYSVYLALLWSPLLSSFFAGTANRGKPLWHAYIVTAVLLGSATAIAAVTWRDVRPLNQGFQKTRLEQLTARAQDPAFTKLYLNFEKEVPPGATVLACLPPDTMEYLLFGEKRTRKILPIRTFTLRREVAVTPDYLLYQFDAHVPLHMCPPRGGDIALGDRHYLRKLDKNGIKSLLSRPETIEAGNARTFKNGLGMAFRRIDAGSFIMGTKTAEKTTLFWEARHRVTISKPYYMQTTEVTQRQWSTVMGNNPSLLTSCPDCPVENISWYDTQRFIAVLNSKGEGIYRLPTEAEWEFAARAGTSGDFFTGDLSGTTGRDANLEKIGWYRGNSWGRYLPIANLMCNPWGLYDMHGNVWEWCQDWLEPYIGIAVTDPRGPRQGMHKICRGGSYDNEPASCRVAARNSFLPTRKGMNLGFRLVYAPQPR